MRPLLAEEIAHALHRELDGSGMSIKTLVRWTDASERTVKHWLAATHNPSGEHLVELARHSDAVFETLLIAAERQPLLTSRSLDHLRTHLEQALLQLEANRPRRGRFGVSKGSV